MTKMCSETWSKVPALSPQAPRATHSSKTQIDKSLPLHSFSALQYCSHREKTFKNILESSYKVRQFSFYIAFQGTQATLVSFFHHAKS